ncbi:MAG: hypothetical protein ACLR43_04240 [Faecalibacillus faecis]
MNYDKFPKINISGYENEACIGKTEIKIFRKSRTRRKLLFNCRLLSCVDDEIFDLIKEIYKPDFVIKSEDVFYEKDELNKMMNPF